MLRLLPRAGEPVSEPEPLQKKPVDGAGAAWKKKPGAGALVEDKKHKEIVLCSFTLLLIVRRRCRLFLAPWSRSKKNQEPKPLRKKIRSRSR